MRNLKIRQLLLLLLRTAIVLCLVLAFSRPTLQEGSGGGLLAERSAIEAVVIVDNSLSLNEVRLKGSLLDGMRQAFSDLRGVFQPGDRLTVLQATRPQEQLLKQETFQDEVWERVLTRLQPNYARSDIDAAILAALQQLKHSVFASREIYVLSDFQKSGFGETLPRITELLKDPGYAGIRLFSLPLLHQNPENLSVDSVEVQNRLVEVNQPLHIRAVLRNHHPDKYLSTLASVVLGDNRVAQQNVNLPPAQATEVQFNLTLTETGFVAGRVNIESDALQEDNQRFFNLYVPEKVQVLHLYPQAAASSYMPLILQPALQRDLLSYRQTAAAAWSSESFGNYDVILLEGLDEVPLALTRRLQQFAGLGGGVVIVPGANVVAAQYRDLLSALNIGDLLERRGVAGNNSQFLTLDRVNWQHPVFEGLFDSEKPGLNPIEVYASYGIRRDVAAQNLVQLSDRSPLLLQGGGTAGAVFFLSTLLNRDWSQLPEKGFIVPLLYRMIYFAGTRKQADRHRLRTGEIYQQEFSSLEAPFDFRLDGPDELEARLTPRFNGSRVFLDFAATATPGNYRIWHNQQQIQTVSVNAWSEESQAGCYSSGELAGLLPGGTFLSSESLVETVRNSRFGKELWRHFLVAALALLLAEMLVARTGQTTAEIEQ